MVKECSQLLQEINNAFGKGDIVKIEYIDDYAGSVHRKMQYGTDVRKFYVQDGKLHFLGHKRVIR